MCPQLLVIGTSILWGQGLPDKDKIHNRVIQLLQDRHIFESKLEAVFLAHSGATLGFKDDDSEDTREEPRVHGEVPTDYPTLLQQLKEYETLGKDPNDVALILVEGGINDVNLERILDPFVSPKTLQRETEIHCYRHMKMLLQRLAAKFPKARIILMTYYPLITKESEDSFLHAFITAMGIMPGVPSPQAMKKLGDLDKDKILLNCQIFSVHSQNWFQAAIDEVNAELGGDPRLALAVPNIQPQNAAFASDPFLFGIDLDLKPQDPRAAERSDACRQAGERRAIRPICERASIGHPNAKGAQAFAEAILAVFESHPTRDFEYRFEPGSARTLSKHGVWFRDTEQRYVLFRGVNFGVRSKFPPYLPILPLDVDTLDAERFRQELETMRPELDCLKQLGFNFIRLLIMWKGLEPRPNPNLNELLPEGQSYLDYIRQIIDALYALGFFVLIDFHQDIAHELYGGDGFPDWALAVDQDHPRPKPSEVRPSTKWMLRYYDTGWTKHDKLVRHTLQSFWRDNLRSTELSASDVVEARAHEVRTHFEKTIGATARYFLALNGGKGHPAILGYEAFNEPHEVGLGAEEFETKVLPDFYRNVAHEIRRVGDKDSFLFVEPRVDWTTYDPGKHEFQGMHMTKHPLTLLDVSRIDDDRLVFSFHYYDGDTYMKGEPSLFPPNIAHAADMEQKVLDWPDMFRQLSDAAISRHLIPFLSEAGADQDWTYNTELRPEIYHHQQIRAYMDLLYQQIEHTLLNSAYWVYDLYNTESAKDNWNMENTSLLGPARKPRNLDIVARVYPMRSSAEPAFLSFDLGSRHGILILHGKPVQAPTVIYIPAAMHYKEGFEVHATSPDVHWDATNQLLYWRPDPNHREHQLIVSPALGFKQSALPAESLNLLSKTVYCWKQASE